MKKKILVVEDEKNLRRLYQSELEAEGYEVVTAANGEEALDDLKRIPIDLVVMDLMFPRGMGLGYLSNFMGLDRNLKVVINSAYPDYKLDFHSWAAEAFLTKSSDLSELKNTIQQILQKNERRVKPFFS